MDVRERARRPCSQQLESRPAIIQGRENIRYGVNAMLVGGVFDDTYAEGRSTIAANTGRPDACWDEGILALATRPDTEEIIAATVELAG